MNIFERTVARPLGRAHRSSLSLATAKHSRSVSPPGARARSLHSQPRSAKAHQPGAMPSGSSSDAAAAAPDRNIGRRVKVYWERDTAWYSGRVVSHTSRRGWRVEYDIVEGEDDLAAWHDLAVERHEWLDDGGTSVATPASSSAAAKKRARAEPSKAAPSKAAQKHKAPSKAPSTTVVVKDERAEDEDEDLVEEVAPPSKGATAGSSAAVNDGDGDDGDDEDIVFMGQTGAVALADFPHVSRSHGLTPTLIPTLTPTPNPLPYP